MKLLTFEEEREADLILAEIDAMHPEDQPLIICIGDKGFFNLV